MALNWGEQMKDLRWIRKSDEIKERDGEKCLVCGSTEHYLEVHHLCYLPGFLAWEYDDELMVTVCRRHHNEITYDLPKIAGLIAFEALRMNIDLTALLDILQKLKNDGRLDKAA